MGEVIKVNFTDIKEDSGYIINGRAVDGVYKADVVAVRKNDSDSDCVIGYRSIDGVINPIELSIAELNEFCLMWLLIFDPEAISEDYGGNQDE